MSHAIIRNNQTDTLLSSVELKNTYNRSEISQATYTIFAFVMALVLICLGLRIIMALLVINNPMVRGLTVVTDPAVVPFTRIFNDAHEMLQGSTALAFTSYYGVYYVISLLSRFVRPTESTSYSR